MMRQSRIAAAIVALVAVSLIAVGCGGRAAGAEDNEQMADTQFNINPDVLGMAYENADLGVGLRPPLDWTPLTMEQRDGVSEALALEQSGQEFTLEIVDVFLHTETFSLAALSRVADGDGPSTELSAYVEQYWENLQAGGEDELRGRTTLRMNGLSVEQIRHVLGDRITFTLITSASDGTIVQLDYSIPASDYAEEGLKLESSIGTLRRLQVN